jgi:hypothetical protein
MRLIGVVTTLVLLGACATSGPPSDLGDPDEELRAAQRMIESAQEAGADSLAILSMSEARAALRAAQDKEASKSWSVLKAREAAASAAYARAVAGRLTAERARNDAAAALNALPPENNR